MRSPHRVAAVRSLLSFLIVATPAGALGQTVPIFSGMGYGAGVSPTATTAHDLNFDGHLDLVTANFTGNDITVLIADAMGGFLPGTSYPTGLRPVGVVVADATGDGIPDLAVLNQLSVSVSLFHGGGAGAFAAAGSITAAGGGPLGGGGNPTQIASGDFDADGRVDLAVVAGDGFRVFLGAPGGFAPFVFTSAPGGARAMAVGDFDEDGLSDVALVREALLFNSQVGIYSSDGDATFTNTSNGFLSPANSPNAAAAGDVNGDGHLDFAFTNATTPTVVLFAGDGAGHVSSLPTLQVPIGASGIAVALGDVNSDGARDAVAIRSDGTLSVAFGNGAGAFSAATPFPVGVALSGVEVADLTGDGRVDVVSTCASPSAAVVLSNLTPFAAGLAPYGIGTHGCNGSHGINASGSPQVGSAGFEFLFTNAPPSTLGALLLGDVQLASGIDYGFGATFLVDLLGSSLVLVLDVGTDSHGFGFAPVPIPANPAIANVTLFAQGFFVTTGACLPTPFGFSTSSALAFTIQP